MKKTLTLTIAAIILSFSVGCKDDNQITEKNQTAVATREYLFKQKSNHTVDETMDRIKKQLNALKIPVFAEFDHKQNAVEVNLELSDNRVIVFGNPAVGTHLMQENPSISQDLPLRINVWKEADGSVWAAFTQMKHLEEKYNMPGNKILGNMQKLLEKLVVNATNSSEIKN